MKARIPKHREFIIDFPQDMDQVRADEGWDKLNQIVEDYKKAHNGQSVYSPTFIEDCEPAVKALQEEYGFKYTVQEIKYADRRAQCVRLFWIKGAFVCRRFGSATPWKATCRTFWRCTARWMRRW